MATSNTMTLEEEEEQNNPSSITKSANDDNDYDGNNNNNNNNNNNKQERVISTGPVVPARYLNEDYRLISPPTYGGMPPLSNIGAKLDEEENVADEDNSSSIPPVPCNLPVFLKLHGIIQNSNGNGNGIGNSIIPFIPKNDRKRIISEQQRKRTKLRASEIRTESLTQQNTGPSVSKSVVY
jgi:hypothetical protein